MDDISPRARIDVEPASPPVSRRRVILTVVVLAALAAAGWYGWGWWTVGRFTVSTDDAYFQADNVTITPQVGGIVTAVPVKQDQAVKAGDVLVQIDDRDYEVALEQAKADLAAAQADSASFAAQDALQQTIIDQGTTDLPASQAALQFAQQEQQRYKTLAAGGAGTTQRVEQSAAELIQRSAAVAHAQAALQGARKQLDVIRAQQEKNRATIAIDQAKVDQAKLNLERTKLVAPSDGVIGDKTVRVGQVVQPGTRLMTVVPVQQTYLVANFKETQIAEIVPGEKVRIEVDAFPDTTLSGTVASLAPGSGSQFSLLPPENATGNFTKIVQRVPIKIVLDHDTAMAGRLRPGLSATAIVDTRSAPAAPSP